MKRKIKTIKINKNNRNIRTNISMVVGLTFFLCIFLRILYLNVFMGEFYNMKLNNEKDIYITGESVARGRILDRNGKVLVGNKSVKSIYYKKPENTTKEDEIKISYQISKILKLDYNILKERNKKEFYILIHEEETNKLITKEEYQKKENRKLSEDDINE